MAPHLQRNVIVGGVTFSAGTEETEQLRELIPNGAAWSAASELDLPEPTDTPVDVDEQVATAVEAAVAAAKAELLDELRAEVTRQIEELVGVIEPAEVQGQNDGGSVADLPEPPRGGKGSGEPEWRVYAEHLGVDVSGVSDRDGIIALVEQHKAAAQ